MFKLKKKIAGFTLLETMVSMVVLMIVFSLSILLIINISSSGMTREKQNAQMFVNTMRIETIRQNKYIDETVILGDLTFVKTLTPHLKDGYLHVLLITASKGAKKLFESKDIVTIKKEK